MTVTASAPRTYAPEVKGAVRLVDGVAGAIDSHLSGAAIRVEIESETKGGPVRHEYGLRFGFWKNGLERVTLTRELPGGENHECIEYVIDATFGNDLGDWTCNCDDFRRKAGKRKIPHCKHTKSCHKVATILGAI